MAEWQISGGISGAITDPYSSEATAHAELYYEEIRKQHTDVLKIAKNTGYSYQQIQMVKNYLFYDYHDLGGEFKQFDPCFEIAESWRRLAYDPQHIQHHDLILLKHEINELQLVAQGFDQDEAHDFTNVEYNYTMASDAYYNKLRIKKLERQRSIDDIER